MPDLKIGHLPARKPVRITFRAKPELARSLEAYADLYRMTYGSAESVSELIPYMLEGFLASDRAFVRARKERQITGPDGSSQKSVRSTSGDLFGRPATVRSQS